MDNYEGPKTEKKRGRPVKENVKWYVVKARMDDDEYAMLDKLHAVTGLSRSNIMRAALRLYYHMTLK